jgi:hypothetical protein
MLNICKKCNTMATIVIDEKSIGAKKMVEFLKTQPYVKIIDERRPSAGLAKSIEEARSGKVKTAKNASELLAMLKK